MFSLSRLKIFRSCVRSCLPGAVATRALEHRQSAVDQSGRAKQSSPGEQKSLVLGMGDVSVKQERISVLCPITQARMQRPGRSSACLHAAAFCTSALPAIRVSNDGHYRCPICSITFAEADIVPDVALLLFIAEHPSASHLAVVRRGDLRSGMPWAYRKASQARNDMPKSKHAQPKRPRTSAHADAGPGPSQQPAGGAQASVSRPIKLEDGAEEATARETAAATGPAVRGQIPKFNWALPLQPVAPPVAPHAAPAPAHTPGGSAVLSAAAMAAASVRRHAAAHAAAPPCGAASAAAHAAAAERQRSGSGCGGGAPPNGHACPAAFSSSKSAAPSGRPAGRSSSEPAGQARKAQQRRERREAAKRTELLAKVKEALIRRTLHEDHPEDCGGASLW